MGQLILNAALKYLAAHPELIEQLVAELFTALLAHLATQNAAPKQA